MFYLQIISGCFWGWGWGEGLMMSAFSVLTTVKKCTIDIEKKHPT
jgi:hypothetical protein